MSASGSVHDQIQPVIIAGAGVAALEAVLALRARAGNELPIELVCPRERFEYRPLLVLEPFVDVPSSGIDLANFAADQGVGLHSQRIVSVDPDAHTVTTADGCELAYQALLVAVGAHAASSVPGARCFRDYGDALALRDALDRVASGRARSLVFAVSNPSEWALPIYELALLARAELDGYRVPRDAVKLLTAERAPLEMLGQDASDTVGMLLAIAGIPLQTGIKPLAFADGVLRCDGHAAVATDFVFAQSSFTGAKLAGLPHDEQGFLSTDRDAAVNGLSDVYAAGDIASGLPKQGGHAARQANAAAASILARAGWAVEPEPFEPTHDGVLLTSAQLAALRAKPAGRQDIKWNAPTKISARHLARYLGTTGPESQDPDGAWQRELRLPSQIQLGAPVA